MKRLAAIAILALTVCAQLPARNVEPYGSCKPYTRWWWFTEVIKEKDIREQLIWAKEAGLGGVEIAWIHAMHDRNNPPADHQKWLSKEWAEIVAYTKACADSLGLGCDYTYGSLWPFSHPDLPKEYGTRTFDKESAANRGGTWYLPAKGRVLDHLSKEAFDWYADKMDEGLKDAYKGSTSAIFVDSWEVKSRAIWNKELGDRFFEKFGYRIEPMMPTIYEKGNEDYYYDYMEVVSEMAIENFYKPFTERAHKNKAISRSQCNGSPTDLLSAYLEVDVPETEALLYEPNFGRIAASAATLGGKPVVSAETFTCLYGFGKRPLKNGVGPEFGREQIGDMKIIADALFANGTNQIVWHGMPYNRVGSKEQHFYATVHLSPTSFFADQLPEFNAYMTRVTEYMRKGHNLCDIAVYLPVEDSHRKWPYPKHLRIPGTSGQFQLRYVKTPDYLEGYQSTWVNRRILTEGKVSGKKLRYGKCTFSAFASDVEFMDIASLRALVKMAEKGLPVILSRTPKQPGVNKSEEYQTLLAKLKSLPNVSEDPEKILGSIAPVMKGDNLPDFWCRQDKGDRYIFIANPMASGLHYPLSYCQAFEDKGTVMDVTVYTAKGPKKMKLDFKPNQSILLHVTAKGEIHEIDLGFTARRIEGQGTYPELL